MSHTPVEQAGHLRVGTVDFVSPDEIKVTLDLEAPEAMALNAGRPRSFPRVNGYLLIPVDAGYLVGQVEWITVERSPFPKRRGMQDFGLVDLPYPLRRLQLNPLGMLKWASRSTFIFQRGAEALPSLGAGVLLPTESQLRAIVESGERRRVKIGTSPLAADAEVSVDPDRLFGRHLAVLGNTGSGKSCSVAGLIRWSLEAAESARGDSPHARFIILDPNGEYARAFRGTDPLAKVRIYRVGGGDGAEELKVPLWFWNVSEWTSFTQASPKAQRPALVHALRVARDRSGVPASDPGHEMRRYLRTLVTTVRLEQAAGTPWATFPKPKGFREKLEKWHVSLQRDLSAFEGERGDKLRELVDALDALLVPRRVPYANQDFLKEEVNDLLALLSDVHAAFGGSLADTLPSDVDAPRPFDGAELLRSLEASGEMLNVGEYVEPLMVRIRSLLSDARMKPILSGADDTTLSDWLGGYIGEGPDDGHITIVDLSLVPSEVVHVVTAVIARMVFEALQRYMKLMGDALPTVLVMEEAHTFIRRYKEDVENPGAAAICCQVFERIAREGRKFGLGLVLSSQRPSELSPTVLSQCNTFLLHRISNDRDQDLVQRLVPDNLRGLLRELPSLPSQNAVLLGWASELPVLVKVRDLPKAQQPRSDDPEFWAVWTGIGADGKPTERKIDWSGLAAGWQASTSSDGPEE